MPVNPTIRAPRMPAHIADGRCLGCDGTYADFRSGVSFADAAMILRSAAKAEGDAGGGFRTRRAVLWVMRAAKLRGFVAAHYGCGPEAARREALRAACGTCTTLCPWCDPDHRADGAGDGAGPVRRF